MWRLLNTNYRRISYILFIQISAIFIMIVLGVRLQVWGDGLVVHNVFFLMLLLIIMISISYFVHLYKYIDFEGVKLRRKQINSELMPIIGRVRRAQHEYAHIITGLQFDINIPEKLAKFTKNSSDMQDFFENHPTILTAVYNKILKAENQGIKCKLEFNLSHRDSWHSVIYDYEVVEIVTNLMDNGIEALDRFKKDRRRKLVIAIIGNKEQIEITIGNSHNTLYEGIVSKGIQEGYTTKEDSINHGYGLFTINQICMKYNGKIDLELSEDISFIKVIFPMQVEGQ